MQTMILQTNAGNKLTNHKAKVPNYCEVWFDNEGMANILCFAKMEDTYCNTYYSAVESAFNVHTENGIIKFLRSAESIYYYKPKYKTVTIMVQSVEDNKSFMSQESPQTSAYTGLSLHCRSQANHQDEFYQELSCYNR